MDSSQTIEKNIRALYKLYMIKFKHDGFSTRKDFIEPNKNDFVEFTINYEKNENLENFKKYQTKI